MSFFYQNSAASSRSRRTRDKDGSGRASSISSHRRSKDYSKTRDERSPPPKATTPNNSQGSIYAQQNLAIDQTTPLPDSTTGSVTPASATSPTMKAGQLPASMTGVYHLPYQVHTPAALQSYLESADEDDDEDDSGDDESEDDEDEEEDAISDSVRLSSDSERDPKTHVNGHAQEAVKTPIKNEQNNKIGAKSTDDDATPQPKPPANIPSSQDERTMPGQFPTNQDEMTRSFHKDNAQKTQHQDSAKSAPKQERPKMSASSVSLQELSRQARDDISLSSNSPNPLSRSTSNIEELPTPFLERSFTPPAPPQGIIPNRGSPAFISPLPVRPTFVNHHIPSYQSHQPHMSPQMHHAALDMSQAPPPMTYYMPQQAPRPPMGYQGGRTLSQETVIWDQPPQLASHQMDPQQPYPHQIQQYQQPPPPPQPQYQQLQIQQEPDLSQLQHRVSPPQPQMQQIKRQSPPQSQAQHQQQRRRSSPPSHQPHHHHHEVPTKVRHGERELSPRPPIHHPVPQEPVTSKLLEEPKQQQSPPPTPQDEIVVAPKSSEDENVLMLRRIQTVLPDFHALLGCYREASNRLGLEDNKAAVPEPKLIEAAKEENDEKDRSIDALEKEIETMRQNFINERTCMRLQIGNLEEEKKSLAEELAVHSIAHEELKRDSTSLRQQFTTLSIKSTQDKHAMDAKILSLAEQLDTKSKAELFYTTNLAAKDDACKNSLASKDDACKKECDLLANKLADERKRNDETIAKIRSERDAIVKARDMELEKMHKAHSDAIDSWKKERDQLKSGWDRECREIKTQWEEHCRKLTSQHAKDKDEMQDSFDTTQKKTLKRSDRMEGERDKLRKEVEKLKSAWATDKSKYSKTTDEFRAMAMRLQTEHLNIQKMMESIGEVSESRKN